MKHLFFTLYSEVDRLLVLLSRATMLKTWYVLLTVGWVVTSENSSRAKCCKCVCTEVNGFLTANCSHVSLGKIPSCSDIKNGTNVFLLNGNLLERVEEDSVSRFVNLSTLDLSSNRIYFIHRRAFRNLRNLSFLFLHNNTLVYNTTVYHVDLFKSLTQLVNLTMYDNGNEHNYTHLSYPDYALKALVSLQALFVDGLENKTFGVGFLNLTNLRIIHITSTLSQCRTVRVTKETFQYLPTLREIYIRNCSLKYIEPGSFKDQIYISTLDLSGNIELGFGGITNATSDIHNTLDTLNITRIVAWDELCVIIKKPLARNLQNTSLKLLIADDNRIEAFEDGAISLLPKSLQTVYMRGNNFQVQKYVSEVKYLEGLKFIDLTGKDERNFNYFQATFHSMFKTAHWDTSFSYDSIQTGYAIPKFILPKHLTNISYTYNQVYYNIGKLSLYAPNLETINMSRNLLTRWLGPVHGLEGLKRIDLSYNFAHKIERNFFQNFPSVEFLDLSFNLLGNQIGKTDSVNIFANLTKLQFLDLTENYIHHLPQFMFSTLVSLKALNISRNRIHTLSVEISNLKQLRTFRVQTNDIQWLNLYSRSQFDNITKYRPLTLDLSVNPFACTCDNVGFIHWIFTSGASGNINFGNLSNYNCYYSSGRNITLGNIESVYNNLSLMCYSYVGLFIGMSCVVFVTLSMTIVGVLFRFRWKLRYFYYAARHRMHRVCPSEETSHDYTYDAFVSFADEDRDFVLNELLHKLETESNLSLNIHQRNFTPGRPIAENIIEAIQTSKKTLVILSKNFLESYWCIYELQMANMESVTTGRDVLLIVMMEHIPTRQIPKQILYHIQTDSYIQYPPEGDTDVFWRNLTDSLKQ